MLRFCMVIDHGEWTRGNPETRVARTVAYARLADQAGFDSIWLDEDPDGWDAFSVLGAISRETHQLRLGPGVTNIFHRNPNLIAASVATLDQLSAGRAFLGIGRGQPEVYDRIFGLDVTDPLGQMEGAIGLLRQWWAPGAIAEGGGLRPGATWKRAIAPVALPPVYIAAAGPRALALAGRVAEGVLFNELATPDYIAWAVKHASAAARAIGRDPLSLSFFVNPALTVTDNPEPILERKKTFMSLVHALPGMDRMLMSDQWDVPAIMARVREAMRTEAVLSQGGLFAEMRAVGDLDAARAAIPVELVDEASAIGTLEVVRFKLDRFVQAGATHIFIDRRGLSRDADEAATLLADLAM